MRKFLYILGAFAMIAVVGVGVMLFKSFTLQAEGQAFVDSAVPAIVTNWSKEQLLQRATPELRELARPGEMQALFTALSAQLGSLVEYQGATGKVITTYITGSGNTVSGSYVAKAHFQNGDASIRIGLRKRNERWMIHNFHVDPVPGNKVQQGT